MPTACEKCTVSKFLVCLSQMRWICLKTDRNFNEPGDDHAFDTGNKQLYTVHVQSSFHDATKLPRLHASD
jgi:hypothetical protein